MNRCKKLKKKMMKSSKVLMPVLLTFTIGTTLVGCTVLEQGQVVEENNQPQIQYTLTKDVESEGIELNNQPTAPHWFPSTIIRMD